MNRNSSNWPKAALLIVVLGLAAYGIYTYLKPPPEPAKLRLVVPRTAYSITSIVAKEFGFFKEEGLDVDLGYVQTGKQALDELLAGQCDFATVVQTNVAFAGFAGKDIRVLGSIEQVRDACIVARRDKGVHSLADLKGKRIGFIKATTSEVFLDRIMEQTAIADSSYTGVPLMPQALQSALVQGSSIEAASVWQPYAYTMVAALDTNAIVFKDTALYVGYMNLASTAKALTTRSEQGQALLRAYKKASDHILNHRQECISRVAKVLELDEAILSTIWDEYGFCIGCDSDLEKAITDEGQWIIRTQPGFESKPLPDYSKLIVSAP